MNDDNNTTTTAGSDTPAGASPPRKPRGFAAISPELRQAISHRGGKAAHARGTAHEFTAEEAREAGRKGGRAAAAKKRKAAAEGTG